VHLLQLHQLHTGIMAAAEWAPHGRCKHLQALHDLLAAWPGLRLVRPAAAHEASVLRRHAGCHLRPVARLHPPRHGALICPSKGHVPMCNLPHQHGEGIHVGGGVTCTVGVGQLRGAVPAGATAQPARPAQLLPVAVCNCWWPEGSRLDDSASINSTTPLKPRVSEGDGRTECVYVACLLTACFTSVEDAAGAGHPSSSLACMQCR
jgi:hypothetical protein